MNISVVLGYKPKMKISDGIRRIYDWIIQNYDRIERNAFFTLRGCNAR